MVVTLVGFHAAALGAQVFYDRNAWLNALAPHAIVTTDDFESYIPNQHLSSPTPAPLIPSGSNTPPERPPYGPLLYGSNGSAPYIGPAAVNGSLGIIDPFFPAYSITIQSPSMFGFGADIRYAGGQVRLTTDSGVSLVSQPITSSFLGIIDDQFVGFDSITFSYVGGPSGSLSIDNASVLDITLSPISPVQLLPFAPPVTRVGTTNGCAVYAHNTSDTIAYDEYYMGLSNAGDAFTSTDYSSPSPLTSSGGDAVLSISFHPTQHGFFSTTAYFQAYGSTDYPDTTFASTDIIGEAVGPVAVLRDDQNQIITSTAAFPETAIGSTATQTFTFANETTDTYSPAAEYDSPVDELLGMHVFDITFTGDYADRFSIDMSGSGFTLGDYLIPGESFPFNIIFTPQPGDELLSAIEATMLISTDTNAAFGSQGDIYQYTVSGTAIIPEPATLGLLAMGGLMMIRRTRRA